MAPLINNTLPHHQGGTNASSSTNSTAADGKGGGMIGFYQPFLDFAAATSWDKTPSKQKVQQQERLMIGVILGVSLSIMVGLMVWDMRHKYSPVRVFLSAVATRLCAAWDWAWERFTRWFCCFCCCGGGDDSSSSSSSSDDDDDTEELRRQRRKGKKSDDDDAESGGEKTKDSSSSSSESPVGGGGGEDLTLTGNTQTNVTPVRSTDDQPHPEQLRDKPQPQPQQPQQQQQETEGFPWSSTELDRPLESSFAAEAARSAVPARARGSDTAVSSLAVSGSDSSLPAAAAAAAAAAEESDRPRDSAWGHGVT